FSFKKLHVSQLFLANRACRGGGVCIYVKEGIEVFYVSIPELKDDFVEHVWCSMEKIRF
ncbi:unnamed protein product, partial [Brachionus calyciflorus]